jgi:hypothetical protein
MTNLEYNFTVTLMLLGFEMLIIGIILALKFEGVI